MLFNKPCTKEEYEEGQNIIDSFNFPLNEWIDEDDMTTTEKKENPNFYVTKGYLKTTNYKECWKKTPKSTIDKFKNLANFDKNIFEEITGIRVKQWQQ